MLSLSRAWVQSPVGELRLHKSCGMVKNKTKLSEREKKKATISFTISSKTKKYLEINLPKEAKDLCSENYKMLTKKIKGATNRWKDTLCFLALEESILLK